jgi:serine O-acetyltransferase
MTTDIQQGDAANPYSDDVSGVLAELQTLRRASQLQRYHGAPPPDLPSREAVAQVVEGLISVLYPRHFGPPGLTPEKTEEFLARTLPTTLRYLQDQLRRELALTANNESDGQELARKAIRIAKELAHSLPKIRALLDTDIRAAFNGDPAAKSIDEIIFCYPGVTAIIRHRIAHQLYLSGAPMLARIISELAHSETAVDIHPGAEIGEGFFIDHGTGVVIGETAIIGRNVRLYQDVTLGAKRFEADETGALIKGQPRHPIIEDDVVIYAGATVLGRITIGRGSSIGGNVWLTHSVPPRSNVTQAKLRTESFSDGAGI